jgi:hypothetical protein
MTLKKNNNNEILSMELLQQNAKHAEVKNLKTITGNKTPKSITAIKPIAELTMRDIQFRFPKDDNAAIAAYDITSLFVGTAIDTYKTHLTDLVLDPRLQLQNTIIQLYTYFKIQPYDLCLDSKRLLVLLDVIKILTIERSIVTCFVPQDLSRYSRKTHMCFIYFRLFAILTMNAQTYFRNDAKKIMALKSYLITVQNHLRSPIDENLFYRVAPKETTENNKPLYDSRFVEFMKSIDYGFKNFTGDIFKHLSFIANLLRPLIYERFASLGINYNTFKVVFFSFTPIIIRNNKHLSTNLNVLSKIVLSNLSKKKAFLNKEPKKRKLLLNLISNFSLILEFYYYYCLLGNLDQFLITPDKIFNTQVFSDSVRMTKTELAELENRETLSNNTFSELTKILVNSTFELSIYLNLHITNDFLVHGLNNASIDISKIKEIFNIKVANKIETINEVSQVITQFTSNPEVTSTDIHVIKLSDTTTEASKTCSTVVSDSITNNLPNPQDSKY